jgi:hypothetical protein
MQNKPADASDTLKEAQMQFLGIGNVIGAAQCSESLGNMQVKYCQVTKSTFF